MPIGRLTKLTLKGFKSIGDEAIIDFTDRNVLIGANGAGKSNLISFFRLLGWAMTPPGNLAMLVGKSGGASTFLFDGPARTPQFEAALTFESDTGTNEYAMRLFHAAGDAFVFADERYRFTRVGTEPGNWTSLRPGNFESRLVEREGTIPTFSPQEGMKTMGGKSKRQSQTAEFIQGLLRSCVVYQFHNTSDTARVKLRWSIDDNRFLKEDAGNLAPFLLRLSKDLPDYYQRIVETIRIVAPQFAEFDLSPENDNVLLQWRERGSDVLFGAGQMSDGTLRAVALISLLLQPVENLPSLILLDEPELGLHPSAISLIAGLIKTVSRHRQVLVATQSAALLDEFEPGDILVAERPNRSSTFRRLGEDALKEWLAEYTLSDLWNKNVFGGRP